MAALERDVESLLLTVYCRTMASAVEPSPRLIDACRRFELELDDVRPRGRLECEVVSRERLLENADYGMLGLTVTVPSTHVKHFIVGARFALVHAHCLAGRCQVIRVERADGAGAALTSAALDLPRAGAVQPTRPHAASAKPSRED